MNQRHRAACVAILFTLAGCTTTEEANTAIQSRWTGQQADVFFSQYGPPVSAYPMASGGRIYTWRGGDKDRYIPAQYAQVEQKPVGGKTVTTEISADGKVTKTSTSSFDVKAPAQQRLIAPARVEALYCEIQITVDPTDRIQSIRASNDTDGEGLSLSRCAEVMGVS